MKDASEPGRTQQSAAVWLETESTVTPEGGAHTASAADVQNNANDRAGTSGGEVGITDGQIRAKVTVSEDYKGAISLMCRDNAGNESPLKLLSAQGGGVIVEDNAPLISFLHKDNKSGRAAVEVTVYDDVDEDSNSHITGGIASVNYQIDKKQPQGVTDQGFAEGIVETCTFDVEVSGAGEHTIMVTAVDNAGNESSLSTSVRIAGNRKETTVIEAYMPPVEVSGAAGAPVGENSAFALSVEAGERETPMGKEPKTGDGTPGVEVYATIEMILGLLYVLTYFMTEQGGMTESDKNEVVSRLIAWAKRGGKLRRYVALAVVFCVLVYYHSIGKKPTADCELSI